MLRSILMISAAVILWLPMSANAQSRVSGLCTVSGPNLRTAVNNYNATCSSPRRDCDRVSGGWWCSSANITSRTVLTRSNSGGGNDQGDSGNQGGGIPAYASRKQPWSDSYSVNGQCYCDTNYDHGLANIRVSTPVGQRTVRQVCEQIRSRRGVGSSNNRTYYNTAQCGRGPINTAPDERVCPGVPASNGNYTGSACNATGASWNLGGLFDPLSSGGGNDGGNDGGSGECRATGNSLNAAKQNYSRQCSLPRRDCDPNGRTWTCSSERL